MEQLRWVCAYCSGVFTALPTRTQGGLPCCSAGCARDYNARMEASLCPPNLPVPRDVKKKGRA